MVEEIALDWVRIRTPKDSLTLKNDFVFAMTGYHPDFAFLEELGIRLTGADRTPAFDPQTLESNVPGIYLAGVVVAGARTSEIFIENGRFHGAQIAAGLRHSCWTHRSIPKDLLRFPILEFAGRQRNRAPIQ